MNTMAQPQPAPVSTITLNAGYFEKRNVLDWVFAAIVLAGGLYAFMLYANAMDVYEKGILIAAIPSAIALGWFWRPLRVLMLSVAASIEIFRAGLWRSMSSISSITGFESGLIAALAVSKLM